MISAKDEAQSIKRIDMINPVTIKNIKTCNELIELCNEVLEEMNINISQFVIDNNLYGYSGEVNIREEIKSITLLRDDLLNKKNVIVNIDGIIDNIKDLNKIYNFTKLMLVYGVYKMYLGEFSRGIAIVEFSRSISDIEDNILTNIEKLNEFIFKFNLSVDITKLNNLSESADILESYYDVSMRIDKGDQLLVTIFDNLKKRKKSQSILESIYNISNNALFHYEIGKKEMRIPKKIIGVIVAITIITGGGLYYFNNESNPIEAGAFPQNVEKKEELNNKPNKEVENKTEDKVEDKKGALAELKSKVAEASKVEDYEYIDSGIKLLSSEEKSSKDFINFEKEYNIKKQGYYYNKGRADMKSGNSNAAISNFKVAYNAKKGEYLDPHITYSLGCALMKERPNDAIKYFEEYLTKYNKMDISYEEESLYNLAMINNSLNNKSKAKKYAQRLQDRYENSIYNNVKLKEILK